MLSNGIPPNVAKYFVYNDEDDLIAEDFNHRGVIDKAMETYLEA